MRSASSRAFLSATCPPAPSASRFFIRPIRTRNRMLSLSPRSQHSQMSWTTSSRVRGGRSRTSCGSGEWPCSALPSGTLYEAKSTCEFWIDARRVFFETVGTHHAALAVLGLGHLMTSCSPLISGWGWSFSRPPGFGCTRAGECRDTTDQIWWASSFTHDWHLGTAARPSPTPKFFQHIDTVIVLPQERLTRHHY